MSAGSDLPAELAPIAWLIGRWAGEGVGGYPTIETFGYRQDVEWSHYGKPALAYVSRTWSLEDGRPLASEAGYWRPRPGGEIEVVLAHPTGLVEVHLGRVEGTRIELSTDVVARTPSAKDVTGEHRLYGLVGDELMYAVDLAAVGQPLQPHVSARLHRM